jgi:hypothetical protein
MGYSAICFVPSDGVFGRFDLVALCGCHTLNVCLSVSLTCGGPCFAVNSAAYSGTSTLDRDARTGIYFEEKQINASYTDG